MITVATTAVKAETKQLLDRLCDGRVPPRTLMIVAHPDDEVIGAGARLRHWRDALTIVHVTDGVPPDLSDARLAGFQTREDYAHARQEELNAALSLAGVQKDRVLSLGMTDQAVVHHLPEVVDALIGLITRHQPEVLLTHSYEGGHPDHDAIALALRGAVGRLERDGMGVPGLLEMASYHAGVEGLRSGEFLPADVPTNRYELPAKEQEFKKRLFSCFASQSEVLRWFRTDVEAYRVAPSYNFEAPPHTGLLFYEQFQIGMTGEEWRSAATKVSKELFLAQ